MHTVLLCTELQEVQWWFSWLITALPALNMALTSGFCGLLMEESIISQVSDHEFSNSWSEFGIFFPLRFKSLTVPSVSTLISFYHIQSSHLVPIPLSDADNIPPSPLYFLQAHLPYLKVHSKETRLLRRIILLRLNVWKPLCLFYLFERLPTRLPTHSLQVTCICFLQLRKSPQA